MTSPPVFQNAAATLTQANGTTNAPAIPAGAAAGDFMLEALSVGSNVVPTKSPTFTAEYATTTALARPGMMYAYRRFVAGEDGDPDNSGTYQMTTGASVAPNSGTVLRFTNVVSAGNPFGPRVVNDKAASSTVAGVTLPNGQYVEDDYLLFFLGMNGSRTYPTPASWTRLTTENPSGIHIFGRVAPASGDIVIPETAISGGTAQSRVAITSLKKALDAAYPSTVIAGSLVAGTGKSTIVAGVEVPMTAEGHVVAGTYQPIV